MNRDLERWFQEELLPEIVEKGSFADEGERQTLEKCELEKIKNFVISFASTSCFARITLRTPGGYTSLDLFVKFQSQEPLFRAKMNSTLQFFNEVFFYNHIKPEFLKFLQTCGRTDILELITPKCYFASHGDGIPEKAIVILEDLRSAGYRLSESKVDLDLKHCLVSVALLARFHAISFAMKFRHWPSFDFLKSSFVDILFTENFENRELYKGCYEQMLHRGIDYLLSQKQLPEDYLQTFRHRLLPAFDACKSLYKPTEPLSVICHGDFNRNNILFKYVNGEVADAKLIDYQRYVYGSPCLDLGLLLYLNTSLELREKHFDHLLEFYYQTLVETISGLVNEPEISVSARIPFGMFQKDFERVAAQHYVIASFFLPTMMTPPDEEFEEDMKYKTFWEMGMKNVKKGGEAVSRKIADVIVDFYKRGFYK